MSESPPSAGARTARLLIFCPDARGIIAAVAAFIAQHDGNILDADQHTDAAHGEFFMRVEIDLEGFGLNPNSFLAAWEPVARHYQMRWNVQWGDRVKKMAVLVSREGHCLSDLLWRWRTGELRVEIPFVASNHDDLRQVVEPFGIPFHHFDITPQTRDEVHKRMCSLANDVDMDFIVLARYMQILGDDFLNAFPLRIINIHHSFLPAFAGPRPYHQAFDRGVKIIGATSHYATAELDSGPIIAQQTTAVGHRDTVEDLVRKGRDLERVVLATAVRAHVEDRILVSKNKTVVFD